MKITLADVARRAGVGAGTVSRVLNDSGPVAPATQNRVREAIEALGYVPNLVARGLAARRTGLVAAVVPVLGYTQNSELVEGIGDYLRSHGVTLMIGRSGYDPASEHEIIEDFIAHRPDAIYITGTTHDAQTRALLLASGLPVVEGGNLTADPIDMCVGYSNFAAMRAMTYALHARGYSEICHVTTGNEPNDRILGRLRGYREACGELGLTARVLVADNTLDGGSDALAQLIALGLERPALQCATDLVAIGALFECQRRHLSVPGQVAISGFDDLALAGAVYPALTTVRIDRRGMARRIGEMLIGRLNGERLARKVVDVGYEIVERGSTGLP